MDQEPDLSEQRPEAIRHQIAETRADLTEKLEALEQRVIDTVADATDAVADTVEAVQQSVDDTVQAVKGTVHDTVGSVKHALDVGRHVDRHPWAMLGGSLAAGFVLGRLLPPRPRVGRSITQSSVETLPPRAEAARQSPGFPSAGNGFRPAPAPLPEARVFKRSLFAEFTETCAPEIQKLKGLAIGALMSVARDWIKQSVAPSLGPQLEQLLDRVTTKLGGEPLPGPVLNAPAEGAGTTNGAGR
jgi:ElaB/YqjD/DUF883 family membrane-anchored ribosome-binding protein